MQQRPPQTDARPLGKIGYHSSAILRKTDAPEFLPVSRVNLHAQSPQGRQRLWHHPFPARLFNGRRSTVRDDCPKAFLARRNRNCQPRRPSANDEYVCGLCATDHSGPFPDTSVRSSPAGHHSILLSHREMPLLGAKTKEEWAIRHER